MTGQRGGSAAGSGENGARAGQAHPRRYRVALLAPGGIALIGALWGGLLRLGWDLPPVWAALAAHHGPLMVAGFLGTVIGMERAVALGRSWAYAAPLATGLGVVALVAAPSPTPAALSMSAGSAIVVAVFGAVLRRHATLPTAVMASGAVVWLAAQLCWLSGAPVYRVVPAWAAFLVLTIAGERLELSRLTRPRPAARGLFLGALGITLAGTAVGAAAPDTGARVAGLGLVTMALWLAAHDVARRTIRQPGLTRFIACCLLAGYAWLGAGGLLWIGAGAAPAGPLYDAILHALFVGFVFSMIFGHAPVILPAVLGARVPFRRAFYAHLFLLHASLLLRVAGDLLGWLPGRRWGGAANALALLLFLAITASAALRPGEPLRPAA